MTDVERRLEQLLSARAGKVAVPPDAPTPLLARARRRRARVVAFATALPVLLVTVVTAGLVATTTNHHDVRVATESGWTEVHDNRGGLTVRYPPGWQRGTLPLMDVGPDSGVLALATYPLHHGGSDCALPATALSERGPTDAFVYLNDFSPYRSQDPSTRPSHFGPDTRQEEPNGCDTHGHNFTYSFPFRDAGRTFVAYVDIGPEATAKTRDQAFAILDSLHFDPLITGDDKAIVGRPYRMIVSTHCGLVTRFDGRRWIVDGPETGNPPAGFGNPFATGTMTLRSDSVAEFRTLDGVTARLYPDPPPTPPQGCA